MRIEPELIPLYAAVVAGVLYLGAKLRRGVHIFDVLLQLVRDVDHRTSRELDHNHGGSMKDDVTGMAVSVGKLQRDQDRDAARLDAALAIAARHHPDDAALYLALQRSHHHA